MVQQVESADDKHSLSEQEEIVAQDQESLKKRKAAVSEEASFYRDTQDKSNVKRQADFKKNVQAFKNNDSGSSNSIWKSARLGQSNTSSLFKSGRFTVSSKPIQVDSKQEAKEGGEELAAKVKLVGLDSTFKTMQPQNNDGEEKKASLQDVMFAVETAGKVDFNELLKSKTEDVAQEKNENLFGANGVQEVKTFEEDEEVLFSSKCKLYQLEPGNPGAKEGAAKALDKWAERGVGLLKLNMKTHLKNQDEQQQRQLRLVMRADSTFRLILNSPLFRGVRPIVDNSFLRITLIDPYDKKPLHFAIKFKSQTEPLALSSLINNFFS
ncbi:hypothetical protein BB560_005059 [Smittium megazygosporum]|uniref:RanBD1 domain-containing protein n=1 Tax=Smittium megazygosporum TaxID=133381 RepID=A0A2T9Z7P9_9FUNG|nr:hypothetical protein BB560_005059 [Smittium megazygosporum]